MAKQAKQEEKEEKAKKVKKDAAVKEKTAEKKTKAVTKEKSTASKKIEKEEKAINTTVEIEENNAPVKVQRIAMIDVDRVVAKSSSVKSLKAEHQERIKELERWLSNVKKQIDKPDSKSVKEKLIKRYDEEFAQKKAEVAKLFSEKLKIVNKEITEQISQIAKENNYDIVISKAMVVFGCDDITGIIEKQIK